MGTNEENIIENFVCFIDGGAGAGPLHRLRLRPKSTGSATLFMDTGRYRIRVLVINSDPEHCFYLFHSGLRVYIPISWQQPFNKGGDLAAKSLKEKKGFITNTYGQTL